MVHLCLRKKAYQGKYHLITVVIPTHKRGAAVVNAVNSILRSSQQPSEIIVIEDRSDEAKVSLNNHISSGKIKYYRKIDGVPGAAATRNFGVSKANEPFVLFLDDDDNIVSTYIATLKHWLNVSSCRWGFGDMLVNGTVAKFRADASGMLVNTQFKRKMSGLGMGFWIERNLYEKVGGLDELQYIDEDTDLCCRLIATGFNPLYIKEGAVNVARDDSTQRLTTSTEASRLVQCYYRTLEKNYSFYENNKDAQMFLLDRVHRVMCKYKGNRDLSKLEGFSKTPTLRLVHFLRELKSDIFL